MNKKLVMTIAAGALALGGAQQASAIPLQTLVTTSGSITIGDKTFSNFSFFTADPLLAAQAALLDVTATQAGGVYFLNWNGNIGVANIAGGPAFVQGDLLLNYTVTANPGVVTMIDQSYTPNAAPAQGSISIGETVKNNANVIVANSHLSIVDLSDPVPEVGDNLYVIPGEHVLHVTKDILFTALAPVSPEVINSVALSQITQSFHQTVPDGGFTAILLGVGFLGFAGVRRKIS